MFILTKALEPDNPSLVDDHSTERCILLVIPNPVGVCHLTNRCGYQREGDAQLPPDAFHVIAVASTAQPNYVASCFVNFSDPSLQLSELLSAWPSVIRMVKDEYHRRLASEIVEGQDAAGGLLDTEIRCRLSTQCWGTSHDGEGENREKK